MKRRAMYVLFLLLGVGSAGEGGRPLHHDLTVRLDPVGHAIVVEDRIDLSGPGRFQVHAGLAVESMDEAFVVREIGPVEGGAVPLREFEITSRDGTWPDRPVPLRLTGTIHHPLVAEEQEYARSFSRTPGTISEEGVVLSGATAWVPSFGDGLVTFKLAVELPAGWDAVSQGTRVHHEAEGGARHVTWECRYPMDEIYLIAAPFTEYSRPAGKATAYAFLRTPDPALANKYLEVTGQYLDLYGKLIGPYPFGKFALVENFWETGYGMPSFTLLGPQIIRFPFILRSSYPHEILHNWWGNSVYVDWETGNWCEGLTAYLADHLIKEGQGLGEEYRRDTLKKYRAYVRGAKDFPLREFRSRHSSATEAVGYGKSLMLFHMVRCRIGDEKFKRGLQAFYRDFMFKRASFDDLAAEFSEAAGEDLRPFFRQWIERTGAPVLAVRRDGDDVVLEQTQAGEPYELRVPVAVDGQVTQIDMKGKSVRFKAAGRVDVDPYFDLFRLLDRREIPPTLGELFGADKVTIVLPAEPGAWQGLADAWQQEGVGVVREDAIDALPADRAVWIVGAGNRWAPKVPGVTVEADAVTLGEARHPREGLSFVVTATHPADPELTLGWIGTDVPEAVPGLARKLPHYGKYSYLAFTGAEPTNIAKGQWEATESPLVLAPSEPRGALPPREPLARLAPIFDAERLMAHVRVLADDGMNGRGNASPELAVAARYIGNELKKAGLTVLTQEWEEEGGPDGKKVRLTNVIAAIEGTNSDWKGQSVVVGAHYDHLGLGWPDVRKGNEGQVHNGADDNASGVAVLLELARVLADAKPPRTIVLAAFAGEEWGLKGSRHYVKAMEHWPAKRAIAMINLDTVGRLEGQKLTLLGTGTADEWKHIAMGVGYTTGVEAVSIPQDPGGSDQVAFHEAGVPAIQVFTGPHEDYHRPTDDIEKVDAEGLVKVATFVREAVQYLAERDRPLTKAGAAPAPAAGQGRRVSLGTMPEFGFAGPGVLVKSVLEGSPAEKAGVKPGDVLLAIDAKELKGLREFSEALKAHAPGDTVKVRLKRGDEELTLEATLTAR